MHILAQISAYCGMDLDVAVLNVPCTTVYIPGNVWNIYFMERLNWREAELKYQGTRMNSSRMRTIRSSSHVYPSMHWAGGVYPSMHWAGGVCPGGVHPLDQRQTLPRPEADAPPRDTTGYSQQTGGTQPTGKHSCESSFHNYATQWFFLITSILTLKIP